MMTGLVTGAFVGFVSWYHLSEALLVRWWTPEEFGLDSFLFSRGYVGAMLIAWMEFAVESWTWPGAKERWWWRPGGFPLALAVVVLGEMLRKAAWLTGKAAFTHRIQTRRRPHHVLVTHGVYAWSRHPGYLGWWWWSIGTQLLLANPISTILFAVIGWNFFRKRIPIEDYHLHKMFGNEYNSYYRNTPTRFPGIR